MKSCISIVFILPLVVGTPILLAQKGEATAGKAVYDKRCVSCHAAGGEGKEAIAKMFKVEIHPLGSKEVQALSDADLRKVIAEGKGKMVAVKGLSDKELADLIAFVRSLKK